MQSNRNLLIYNAAKQTLSASGGYGSPGSRLAVQDGGGVIYRANGSASWASTTDSTNIGQRWCTNVAHQHFHIYHKYPMLKHDGWDRRVAGPAVRRKHPLWPAPEPPDTSGA